MGQWKQFEARSPRYASEPYVRASSLTIPVGMWYLSCDPTSAIIPRSSEKAQLIGNAMADPFTVVGSLAAVIQLARHGVKFARSLKDFADTMGSATKEIDEFSCQVREFAQTIKMAKVTLSRHCSRNRKSPVIRDIRNKGILTGLENLSIFVQDRVKRAKDRVEAMMGRIRIVAKLNWSFSKESILKLLPQMDRIKSTIIVVLQIVALETMTLEMEQLLKESNREDIKALEQDM